MMDELCLIFNMAIIIIIRPVNSEQLWCVVYVIYFKFLNNY